MDDLVPPIDDYDEPALRTSGDVAVRAIILHCVAAVGYEVDPHPIVDWLKDQDIWGDVSPNEQAFLSAKPQSDKERSDARWHQEAQWALLWSISKIESLGLPTQTCDTGRLVDELMPALGDPIGSFVSSAELRPPS